MLKIKIDTLQSADAQNRTRALSTQAQGDCRVPQAEVRLILRIID